MKLYLIYDKENKTFIETENKREANKYLNDANFVVCVEGRKGSEIKRKKGLIIDYILSDRIEELDKLNCCQKVQKQIIMRTRSKEHNEKIGKALKNKPKSVQHCEAISNAMMGNNNFQN